jgi:CubicO group peptidase (beta-lactamase class C family)
VLKGVERRRFSLGELMRERSVPGLSVAVVDRGRLDWARAFGVADAVTGRRADTDTLFQAGSISKAIKATVALRLVDQSRLSLDVNVNAYLCSWAVPENEFTTTESVTLRRLLSHTAGLNSPNFVSWRAVEAQASIIDLLEGRPPAGDKPVRVEHVPGSRMQYSNGGALVAQLVVEEVTGELMHSLAESLVFQPLQMNQSTFRQPLSPQWEARTAAAHDSAGARYPGRYTVPVPMSHLWTTPKDLLKWARALSESYRLPSGLVSQPVARQMLSPQIEGAPTGLGTFVWGTGATLNFQHGGRLEGAAAEVIYYPALDAGAAVMVNGDGGAFLVTSLMNALGVEYGWPGSTPRKVDFEEAPVDLITQAVGTYVTDYPKTFALTLSRERHRLFVRCFKLGIDSELVLVAPNEFVTTMEGWPMKLEMGDEGRVTRVNLGGFVFSKQQVDDRSPEMP